MGAIGGMLGLDGGASGSGFGGPGGSSQGVAGVVTPTSMDQINSAYNNSGMFLQSQQNLLNAIQSQNGLGNQSNVYNQLQGVANGTGPNAAQAQYHQNVQNLAQQQAGALASTKGISPALQARLISQQGSAAMQNSAAQGATNQAQQQLGAMGAMGTIANAQAANQIGQTNANTGSSQAEQQMLLNAQAQANNANSGLQSNINSTNSGLAQTQMKAQQGIASQMATMGGMFAADGGEVPSAFVPQGSGPQSQFAQFVSSGNPMAGPNIEMPATQGWDSPLDAKSKDSGGSPGIGSLALLAAAKGGRVPAMVSPGELWLPPGKLQQVAKGKNPLEVGEKIPGKPKVPGNSYENDVVPAKLEVGGVVIPNSIMQSKDPAKGARDMVAGIIAKRKVRK